MGETIATDNVCFFRIHTHTEWHMYNWQCLYRIPGTSIKLTQHTHTHTHHPIQLIRHLVQSQHWVKSVRVAPLERLKHMKGCTLVIIMYSGQSGYFQAHAVVRLMRVLARGHCNLHWWSFLWPTSTNTLLSHVVVATVTCTGGGLFLWPTGTNTLLAQVVVAVIL